MASSSVLVLCVAVVLCGVVSGDSVVYENRCDSSCEFDSNIWDVTSFSQNADLPPGLQDYGFDYFALDGDETWYEDCLLTVVEELLDGGYNVNFWTILQAFRGNLLSNCVACRPSYVYLYESQFRLLPPLGLVGDITYLSGAYSPSTSAWNSFCTTSTYDLPNADNVTEAIAGADLSLAFTPACYSIVSCSYTQTVFPLQASRSCTPRDYQDTWPTKNYCSFVYGVPRLNFSFNTGCNGLGCESLKFTLTGPDLLSRRKFSTQRLGRLDFADTDPYASECLATDESFFER